MIILYNTVGIWTLVAEKRSLGTPGTISCITTMCTTQLFCFATHGSVDPCCFQTPANNTSDYWVCFSITTTTVPVPLQYLYHYSTLFLATSKNMRTFSLASGQHHHQPQPPPKPKPTTRHLDKTLVKTLYPKKILLEHKKCLYYI